MKINNRMLVFLLVCSSNIEIYPIGVEKKRKKSMLNIIRQKKRKTKPTDNTFIDTTYLTKKKKKKKTRKMINFAEKNEESCLLSKQ
jgi:hypothetical protein